MARPPLLRSRPPASESGLPPAEAPRHPYGASVAGSPRHRGQLPARGPVSTSSSCSRWAPATPGTKVHTLLPSLQGAHLCYLPAGPTQANLPVPSRGWVSPRRLAQLDSQRTASCPQTCGPYLPDLAGGSSDLPTPAPALPSQPWLWLGLGRGPGTCPLDRRQCPLRTEGSCPLGMFPGDREKVPVPQRSVSWVSKISLRRNNTMAMGPHHVTLTLKCHVSMETQGQPPMGGVEPGSSEQTHGRCLAQASPRGGGHTGLPVGSGRSAARVTLQDKVGDPPAGGTGAALHLEAGGDLLEERHST